jgi:RTA1 like protein
VSLLLQAAGGVTASMSDGDKHISEIAINVMVAGLSFQVVSLAIFAAACTEFGLRVRRERKEDLNPSFADVRPTLWFRAFLWVLGLATLAILLRSVFRCAELKDGFQGPLANDEITFMILEGAMIVFVVLLMTACHPGIAFQDTWNSAGWHLRTKISGMQNLEMGSLPCRERGQESGEPEVMMDPSV